jgi:subfamily B ATP-binding cassette protein MsbA
VNHLLRFVPYLWPHRGKILLSTFFAVLVAAFWTLNLSVAFPVVKVLLQGKTLQEYVEEELKSAETDIVRRTWRLEAIESDLAKLAAQGKDADPNERVDLLRNQSNQQTRLSDSTRQRLIMSRLQTYVVPWLPRDQFKTLAAILGVLVVATLLKGVFTFIQEVMVGSVVELTIIGIRKDCLRRVLKLDYHTLTKSGTSGLMSRFTYDMEMMGQGLNLIGGKVIREPLKAFCCLAGAFMVSWQLTLLSLLFVPLVGAVFYSIGRKLKQASHRVMESVSKIYKTLEETFDSLKIVIAFNGARHHRRQFHKDTKKCYEKAMKIVRLDALTAPTTEFLGLMAAFMALLPGAYLVLRGSTDIAGITLIAHPMDVAELSVLYVMLVGVMDPVRKLSTTYAKLKRAHAAGDRIFGLLDTTPIVKQAEEPKPAVRHTQSIEFRRIGFSYPVQEEGAVRPAALDDVSLDVSAGEVIVVVGENGSGKSTLVNLLPRYYDPNHGEVLIDGVDIRDLRFSDLRGQIGYVTQETLLFDETIADNIRYGKPSATNAEILAAATRAHVDSFVKQLPEGYSTRVGEKGNKLSGGQRQRIALARAMLRDPAILILDEATSAIDAQSERLIFEALRGFAKGRTTFIITHTVSASILDFVSRIVVMDQGKLIAVGPHEAVLQTCPIYQRLFHARHQRKVAAEKGLPETLDVPAATPAGLPGPVTGVSTPADETFESGTDLEAGGEPSVHIIPLRTASDPRRPHGLTG